MDSPRVARLLEASGGIDRVAPNVVGEAPGPDNASGHRSGVDSDPETQIGECTFGLVAVTIALARPMTLIA